MITNQIVLIILLLLLITCFIINHIYFRKKFRRLEQQFYGHIDRVEMLYKRKLKQVVDENIYLKKVIKTILADTNNPIKKDKKLLKYIS